LQACAAKTAVELIPTLSGDYPAGTALYKYQWDLIHNPERIWFSWLEEEEEGMGTEPLNPKSFIAYFYLGSDICFYLKIGESLTTEQEALFKRQIGIDNDTYLIRWRPETDVLKIDKLGSLRYVFFYEITNTNGSQGFKGVNGIFLYNNKEVSDDEIKAALQTQKQIELTIKVLKKITVPKKKADGTVVKEPLKKEAILGTIKISVTTDVSKFKVTCKRKDYPIKEYTNDQRIGLSINGEASLKQGEIIELTLQEQDDKGSWNEVVNALWQADNDANAKTTTKYIPIIDDKLNYVAVKKDNNGPEIRINFEVEQTSIIPTTTNTSVTLVPDVTQLAASDQTEAKSKFTTAMTTINTKNSALYTTVTNSGLTVMVYIEPKIYVEEKGIMVEKPNLAGLSRREIIEKTPYRLLSVDMFEFEGEAILVSIDQLGGGAYKNKVVKGAKLVTGLLTDERNNIIDASNKKDIYLLRTDIRNKIKYFNPSMETELVTKVQNGTVDDAFLDKIKYEVAPADLPKYCKLGKGYEVHLNYGHHSLNNQKDLTKVLAHEFKHIDYGINNFYEVIKWTLIRQASNNETLFNLKDQEGKNGSCGCSEGDGHEKNNPENCTVCDEEKNF
jgi:hypothetical protein